MFNTDISSVKNKGAQVLGSASLLFVVLIFSLLYLDSKTDLVYKQLGEPIVKKIEQKAAEEAERLRLQESMSPANSYSDVNVQINNNVGSTSNDTNSAPAPTVYYYQYQYQTPTTAPQQNTQNNEDFWNTWNERSVWIDEQNKAVQDAQAEDLKRMQEMDANYNEMKQKVEESQKNFCNDNPTLCK